MLTSDKRHYGQFCGLAAALDIIGERWTLLIVRELIIAPARFHEIQAHLPGIGPNLLTDRLKALSARGILEAEPVPGDARGKRYRLTSVGEQLREPLLHFSRWGMRFLTDDDARSGMTSSAWGFFALQAMIQGRPVPDVRESYEFRIDDDIFHIVVADGRAVAHRGAADAPAIVVRTSAETFVRIGAELISPFDAVVTGSLTLDGDPAAVLRCTQLMGLSAPPLRDPTGVS
ncbi:winged helix-turn-helix transcriptional regulator [Streptosporangium sp. DT93]|uniref:winged helix-turn-helix transcriptional regulator n=1 Tax=Streptosporangium sp. DT93 TaxID=3393428 RepID=UPI003CED2AEF